LNNDYYNGCRRQIYLSAFSFNEKRFIACQWQGKIL